MNTSAFRKHVLGGDRPPSGSNRAGSPADDMAGFGFLEVVGGGGGGGGSTAGVSRLETMEDARALLHEEQNSSVVPCAGDPAVALMPVLSFIMRKYYSDETWGPQTLLNCLRSFLSDRLSGTYLKSVLDRLRVTTRRMSTTGQTVRSAGRVKTHFEKGAVARVRLARKTIRMYRVLRRCLDVMVPDRAVFGPFCVVTIALKADVAARTDKFIESILQVVRKEHTAHMKELTKAYQAIVGRLIQPPAAEKLTAEEAVIAAYRNKLKDTGVTNDDGSDDDENGEDAEDQGGEEEDSDDEKIADDKAFVASGMAKNRRRSNALIERSSDPPYTLLELQQLRHFMTHLKDHIFVGNIKTSATAGELVLMSQRVQFMARYAEKWGDAAAINIRALFAYVEREEIRGQDIER